mmetsp:Transcript_8364/g.17966  ORF Transcript_8364/g.17966 Transcript_8364/m.17966 type:complete len:229 (-) Transcript_8364:1730-2416(-)
MPPFTYSSPGAEQNSTVNADSGSLNFACGAGTILTSPTPSMSATSTSTTKFSSTWSSRVFTTVNSSTTAFSNTCFTHFTSYSVPSSVSSTGGMQLLNGRLTNPSSTIPRDLPSLSAGSISCTADVPFVASATAPASPPMPSGRPPTEGAVAAAAERAVDGSAALDTDDKSKHDCVAPDPTYRSRSASRFWTGHGSLYKSSAGNTGSISSELSFFFIASITRSSPNAFT